MILLHAVYVPLPKLKIKGEEHVHHFQGIPYLDIGAEATILLADGTATNLVVVAMSTVPSGCDTLGEYEVEYEAFGPGCECCGCRAQTPAPLGKRVTARRIVEIGSCA